MDITLATGRVASLCKVTIPSNWIILQDCPNFGGYYYSKFIKYST
jgi:hypothetical protein